MVRTKSGGEMQKCLDAIKDKNEFITIIKERAGAESSVPKIPLHRKITLDKISNKILHLWLRFVRALVPKSLRNEVFIQTSIGERHKFMYDEISLSSLLESVGFRNIKVLDYRTSSIPDFNSYKLDINADGSAYKGTTSLYIECEK